MSEETYLGDYDDSCIQCGLEQTVPVHVDQTIWYCYGCEHENEVNEVE